MNDAVVKYDVVNAGSRDELTGPGLSIKTARLGAELFSLRFAHPSHGTVGLLLNDNEPAPEHPWWNSHAPILFPIVGGLVNNSSRMRDGTEITLKNHGFARKTVWTLMDQGAGASDAWIEYGLDDSSIPPGCYPWKFSLTVRYRLSGMSLGMTLRVTNNDTKPLWYQIGWHPGFATPFVPGTGRKSNVSLILPQGMYTVYECDDNSFLTGSKVRKRLGNEFPFTEQGLARTYVLDMTEVERRSAALYDPASGITVTLSFQDMPHLGIWSNGPFICMEPWQGCDDYARQTAFEEKFGIVSLDPGKIDTREIVLSVNLAP
jgi:galactose mutarotase-like enzyme